MLYLEIIVVVAIVVWQIRSYFTTIQKIEAFGVIFPEVKRFFLIDTEQVFVHDHKNDTLKRIVTALNVYLSKNKGAAADFHLMKDVVERHTNIMEEEINQRLPLPLYMGLMGTMGGIILGLSKILFSSGSSSIDEEVLGEGISTLLGGVAIAVLASLIGVLLMILSSAQYREAKRKVEINKNDFYTFLQTELLPVLNQSVTGSLHQLQQGFARFTNDFKANIAVLGGLISHNSEALLAQKEIFKSLETIDIAAFAQANITILGELRQSTQQIERFNNYLNKLHEGINQTSDLEKRLRALVERTDSIEAIGQHLENHAVLNQQALHVMEGWFRDVDTQKAVFLTSLGQVDNALEKSLREFSEHIQEKMRAIREITIREEDLLTKALAENRNHLGKLQYLESLDSHLGQFKNNTISQSERLRQDLHTLSGQVRDLRTLIETEITKLGPLERLQGWFLRRK